MGRFLRTAGLCVIGLATACGGPMNDEGAAFGTASVMTASGASTQGSSGSDDDSGSSGETTGSDPTTATTTMTGPTTMTDDPSSSTSGEPPFSCAAVPFDSPNLAGEVLFDPADPHPGDTLNVIVKATNGTSRTDAPPMDLEITSADGVQVISPLTVQGGDALYYYAMGDMPPGDVCIRGVIGGQTEVASRVEVTPRPPSLPSEGGAFKIVTNHQWTCDEQPGNGNELHVWVRDENGQAIPDARIQLGYADSTDATSIYNADEQSVPTEIVTGSDGHGMVFNYWPISDNGLMTLTLEMDGVASDVATEITTGWWESIDDCNYCGTPTVNVWGHWSHTVEFVRDPNATELCVVPSDHAGMNGCPVTHIHHDPESTWCWPL